MGFETPCLRIGKKTSDCNIQELDNTQITVNRNKIIMSKNKSLNISETNYTNCEFMQDKQKLKEMLQELALFVNYDQPFKLASGVESPFIFNVKNICFNDGTIFLADALLGILDHEEFDYISGLEVGAIPIVESVCCRSRFNSTWKPVNGFFVRKKEKEHGTKNKIDGLWHEKQKLPGSTIVVLDDVTTSGDSVLTCVKDLRSFNCKVEKVITVIDRKDGAEEKLKREGIKLIPLFTVDDFFIPTKDEWSKSPEKWL